MYINITTFNTKIHNTYTPHTTHHTYKITENVANWSLQLSWAQCAIDVVTRSSRQLKAQHSTWQWKETSNRHQFSHIFKMKTKWEEEREREECEIERHHHYHQRIKRWKQRPFQNIIQSKVYTRWINWSYWAPSKLVLYMNKSEKKKKKIQAHTNTHALMHTHWWKTAATKTTIKKNKRNTNLSVSVEWFSLCCFLLLLLLLLVLVLLFLSVFFFVSHFVYHLWWRLLLFWPLKCCFLNLCSLCKTQWIVFYK